MLEDTYKNQGTSIDEVPWLYSLRVTFKRFLIKGNSKSAGVKGILKFLTLSNKIKKAGENSPAFVPPNS